MLLQEFDPSEDDTLITVTATLPHTIETKFSAMQPAPPTSPPPIQSESKTTLPVQPTPPTGSPLAGSKTSSLSKDQIRGWNQNYTPDSDPTHPAIHPEDDSDSSDDEAEGAILLEAAEHGSVKQIRRLLINCGGDPDVVLSEDCEGRTSLHLAALESRPVVMQVMLENAHIVSSANRRDMFGCTPLLLVCVKPGSEENKIKCVTLLINAGALVQIAWTSKMLNRSCLHWCAIHGFGNLSALLVRHPGSTRLSCMKDFRHRLPMDVAGGELMELKYRHIERGPLGLQDVKIIQRIQEREAALRALVGGIHQRTNGPRLRVLQSQLCWGSYLGSIDVVTKVLSHSSHRIKEGRESIHFGWCQIYSLEGMTALHFASLMGHDDVIDALVTYHREHYMNALSKLTPIPLCSPDHYGNFPLHLASMYSNFPNFGPTEHTIKRLLSSGSCDAAARLNADGRTAASYARNKVRDMFAKSTNCYENAYVKNKKQLSFDYIIRFDLIRESKMTTKEEQVQRQLQHSKSSTLHCLKADSRNYHKLTKNSMHQVKSYLVKHGLNVADAMDRHICMLMITSSNSVLRKHAERLRLKLPVLGRRKNATYESKRAWVFEPLRSRERIQIIKALIDKEFDLNVFKTNKIVVDYFPIHEETELEGLRDNWTRGCCPDPWKTRNHLLYESRSATMSGLSIIATYFGEEKAMYFGFVSFYSLYLLCFLVLPGMMLCLYQAYNVSQDGLQHGAIHNIWVPLFAAYTAIWATICLERWKRKAAELAFRWDTTHHSPLEVTRSAFKGPEMFDERDGQVKKYFTARERHSRTLAGSPLWLAAITGVVAVQLLRIWFRDTIAFVRPWPEDRLYSIAASTVQGGVIAILNMVYRRVALYLTQWENHQTESAFKNALILKTFVFQAINGNLALVHAAFIDPDPVELWTLLIILMAGVQISNTIKQILKPKLLFWCRAKKLHASERKTEIVPITRGKTQKGLKHQQTQKDGAAVGDFTEGWELHNKHERALGEVLRNCAMNSPPSTGSIGDYAEMVSQYTYVVLWSAVFPLAPFFAVLVNYTQLRGEMSLTCDNIKRSFPTKADNIGAWLPILEAVSMLSVISNTVLIVHTFQSRLDFQEAFPAVGDANATNVFSSDVSFFWLVALIEHLVILLKLILSSCMDDVPHWVKQLEKVEQQRVLEMEENMEDDLTERCE